MGAPIGNQFWKMRSKHGRDKIFTDPEILLQACYEYFNYQVSQEWEKKDVVKGGEFTGQIVSVGTATPFTMPLLCAYLHVHSKYLLEFEQGLKLTFDDKYPDYDYKRDKDFSDVITHVREIVGEQQYQGAVVGAFNPAIIAKRLGLAEVVKNEITGKDGGPVKTDGKLTIEMLSTKVGISDSEKDIQDEVNRELGLENE